MTSPLCFLLHHIRRSLADLSFRFSMVSGTIPLDSYFGSTSSSASKSKPRVGDSGRNVSAGDNKSSTSPLKKRKRLLHIDDEEDYEDSVELGKGVKSKKGKSERISGGAGDASSSKGTKSGMCSSLLCFFPSKI